MRVLGLISGTSADGIDVALARISGSGARLRARLENFCTVPYPHAVRKEILRIAEGASASAGQISQLNFLVGEYFAAAALDACRRFRVLPRRIDFLGSHGQTIYHQGRPGLYLGRRVASTLQIGEPAVVAARTGIPVVADFRPADMAAGGQGAPLVPFVDFHLYRHPRRGRAVLNIGGIANITVIPPAASSEHVFAFDTGPGNMLIDALAAHFSRGRERFDRNARRASRGRPNRSVLDRLLADSYFHQPPPKSAGREQYGHAYVQRFLRLMKQASPSEALATATLLTALSILDALHRFVLPKAQVDDLIVSGGGAHNPLILAQLAAGLRGIRLVRAEELGVDDDAKEAFAFAVLAHETWHGRPANLPAATGAKFAAILGNISLPPGPNARGQ